MSLRFGTDGVRGHANDELTVEACVAFGRAAAGVLGCEQVLLGRDTRRSGPLLAAAVAAGVASAGVDVADLGVLPTPGVAHRCASERTAGIVVSASHNPFDDNGLKVFSSTGGKLAGEIEAAIEREMDAGAGPRPSGRRVGTIVEVPDARAAYAGAILELADRTALEGLHVVVDCANGAASGIAPGVFERLGARVTAIGDAPDGCNINDAVGSTSPATAAKAVLESGADLGVALDGDADRCVAIDRHGNVLDGDWLLALFALEAQRRGTGGGVVVTVMSNLGFHRAMRTAGIDVVEVPVGDRHVLEALGTTGWRLGGEQSGHVIFADRASTGDGVLTAVLLAQLVAQRGPLHELADGLLVPVPQVLENVEVVRAGDLKGASTVWRTVDEVRAALGERGRVVLRASGTEPCVRIMVEAEDRDELDRVVARLRASVLDALGGPKAHG